MASDSNARTGEEMEEEHSIIEGRAPRLPPISTAGALDLDGSISDNDPAKTPTSELSSIPSLVHTPAVSWTSEDLNLLPQGLPLQDPQNGHSLMKQRGDYFSPSSQNTHATESSRATHKASTPPALDEDLICIKRHSNSASQSPEPRLPLLTRGHSNQAVIGPTSSSQPARLRTQMRRRRDGPEYSAYLNQTFAAAQQQHPLSPHQPQPLRTQGMAYSATSPRSRAYSALTSGAKTVGNTPTQSPGLFTPTTRHNSQGDESEESPYNTPMLHPTHLQKPKETHKLLKDYDPVSGRKVVNNYEFLEKLGSGQHGTVKLGRQVGCTKLVAIKIVRRFSKKLRLGKSGDPNDMIKKEVAILKKARHEHVVSLLEVIDDDEFGKVYLVLEFVERGEIVWRKKTDKDIAVFEMERVKREKLQQVDDAYEEEERRKFNASVESRRKETFRLLEQRKIQALEILKLRAEERRRNNLAESPFWSLEYSTDLEEELVVEICHEAAAAPLEPSTIVDSEKIRFPSSQGHPRRGKISDQRSHDIAFQSALDQIIATESAWTTEEEEFMQVPCLTISQALDAFRDTVLGLEYLHYQGIIHRDIKPANLLWTSDRRVKISDFGVSYLGKPIREDDNNEERAEADADDLDEAIELAKTVGTPAFYAPELCDPELFDVSKNPDRPLITGQIDVWALGVTLYAMIFGRLPFFDVNEFVMYEKIARQEVFIPRIRLKGVENLEADSAMDQRTQRLLTELRSAENTNPEEIRMLESLRQENSSSDSMAMNKRYDDILEYEEVDDDLRDLLKRLLDKQPLKRINLKEVKRHPWVLRGIVDKSAWIDKTDPSVQSQGRKIEVSTEEVQEAVVEVSASISLVDRTFDHIKSTFRRLGSVVRGRPDGRKRRNSNSNAVEKTVYTSASKGSSNSPNGRRSSLRGDERYSIPHATKEGSEHPLSQSIVATPELKSSRTNPDENRDLLSSAHEPTYRPTFLGRTPSNAESTKTIKSVAPTIIPGFSPSLGEMAFPPMTHFADSHSSSGLGAFGRRFLNNMSINRRARSGESASQSSRSSSVENRSQINSSSIESLHLLSRSDRRPGSQFSRASSHRRRTICSTADLSCPISEPIFRERQASFAHSDDVLPIAVSSSSDQIASSMSESTSHPSIASVVSGASSVSMVTDEYQSLLKDVSNPSTIVSKSPRSVLAPDDIVDHLSVLNNKTEGDSGTIDEDEAGYNGEGELDSDSDEGIEIGRRRPKQ